MLLHLQRIENWNKFQHKINVIYKYRCYYVDTCIYPFHSIKLFFPLSLKKSCHWLFTLCLILRQIFTSFEARLPKNPQQIFFFPLEKVGRASKIGLALRCGAPWILIHLQGHFPTDHRACGQHLSGLGPPVTHSWLMHKEYEHSKIWQLCTAWLHYVGNSVFTWKKEDKLFFCNFITARDSMNYSVENNELIQEQLTDLNWFS